MAITYKVAKCRNPKNPNVDYFKGTAVKTGDYDFEELAEAHRQGRQFISYRIRSRKCHLPSCPLQW
jgi:hypothetical protein